MKVYFCAPYSPGQRDRNENTNGLIRQYFPKGTSFKDLTYEQLQEVVHTLNNRTRKRVGHKTPLDILSKFFE